MHDIKHALALLQQDARPAELTGMARFGIDIDRRLGLSMPAMRRAARTLGHDHALAMALWDTGIPDARIVAGMVAEPAKLTSHWALRNIGKRNLVLNAAAIAAARCIQQQDTRSARWIAADALRELASDAVQKRLRE